MYSPVIPVMIIDSSMMTRVVLQHLCFYICFLFFQIPYFVQRLSRVGRLSHYKSSSGEGGESGGDGADSVRQQQAVNYIM